MSERDRQAGVLEGLDIVGVLPDVPDAVVVRVRVAGVHLRAELATVVQAVTVLVAPALLDLQGEVMSPLPAVGQAVVVAVARPGRGRGHNAQGGHEGQGEDEQLLHGRLLRREVVGVHPGDTTHRLDVTALPAGTSVEMSDATRGRQRRAEGRSGAEAALLPLAA